MTGALCVVNVKPRSGAPEIFVPCWFGIAQRKSILTGIGTTRRMKFPSPKTFNNGF
ncbi:MAG: hypothetical protein ACJAU6_001462 [Alphaproteobacteria bacterium]|jgi:hypothetical protein